MERPVEQVERGVDVEVGRALARALLALSAAAPAAAARPAELARHTSPTRGAGYWQAFADFGDSLEAAGVLRGGTAPETGAAVRTVAVRGGAPRAVPGGAARAGEQLGGYFVIAVPSLDAAAAWAARAPAALAGSVVAAPSFPAPTMTPAR